VFLYALVYGNCFNGLILPEDVLGDTKFERVENNAENGNANILKRNQNTVNAAKKFMQTKMMFTL